ncbi:MAG: FecR family protein [Proteobacteria bacterium]|nr:FecR family protein [Pseudomonadota bacterium]
MKDHTNTPDNSDQAGKVDAAIDAIKADVPSAAAIASASDRAQAAIASQRGPHVLDKQRQAMGSAKLGGSVESVEMQSSEKSQAPTPTARWDSIDDYIAAIPAYLAKQLSSAQTTLFEEETRQSIPLRRALDAARGGQSGQSQGLAGNTVGSPLYRWLAAAATVAAIAIGLFVVMPQLPSFDQSRLAQVDAIDGQLYQLVDGRLQALTPGTWINGRQRIRSAGASSALITLDDGSQIEVDERSELSMTRRGSGNRIDVSRGRILVQASPQGSGTLDVFTDELMVSVTGTIFEVAHGAKGSRVAVIEGSVNVLLQGDTTALEPGEVMDSRTQVFARSVIDEIAWSQNADQYIAMLQEVAALQQDLQAVLDVPPRYSTRLLDLAPASTAVYIAVPNAPEKIVDVYDVVRARMQGSETLGEYWTEFESASEGGRIDEVMNWLREIGYALGEETVVAITMSEDGSAVDSEAGIGAPVILSEVDAEAFRAAFENQMEQLRAALEAEGLDAEMEVAIIDDPADARDGELSILLVDDILIASINAATLIEMQANLDNGGSAFVGSDLHGLLQTSYAQGTEILGAVHFPQLFSPLEMSAEVTDGFDAAGLANMEYLVAQHRQENGETSITADIFFDGERQGAMAWLANAGPMGSLEFFSTDTTFATALLLKEPGSILDEFGPLDLPEDFDAQAELELFYEVIGILGGEVAFGLDGPALPTPAWKVVIEAYDATVLQQSIEWSVARFNEYVAGEEAIEASLALTPANVAGYTGYKVNLSVDSVADTELDLSSVSFHYAYVDGYLVAAADRGLVDRGISYYESGSGLQTDSAFRELLSRDGYLDFSLVSFSRLGELLGDVMSNLPSALTEEQQAAVAAIDGLDNDIGPSISSILALPDRMHLVHNGSSQLPVQILSQLIALQPLIESVTEQNISVTVD